MKNLSLTFCLAIATLLASVGGVSAHFNCQKNLSFDWYLDIKKTDPDLTTLTTDEKFCFFEIFKIIKKSRPPNDSRICSKAWNEANDTGEELISAADDLINCLERWNHDRDCGRAVREIQWAQNEYEDAVSEVDDICN